jgi:hypothetical protein
MERNRIENERMNAERNAAQRARQATLLERRAAAAEEEKLRVEGISRRAERSWVDAAFRAQLRPFSSDNLIDPAIFDGSPNFERVLKVLVDAGIYVDANIHGNEKGIARWVGADGKNVMVWFDRPHGAQLQKGENAGWVRGLEKALKESGRLAPR